MTFACNGSSHTATSPVRFWKTCLWVSGRDSDAAELRVTIGLRINLADLCRHHEHDLPREEHPGVCRPRAGLQADARESLQPRAAAVDGNCCPLAEHLDKRSNARLQGSTYACIGVLL